jgi:hypothetical protein
MLLLGFGHVVTFPMIGCARRSVGIGQFNGRGYNLIALVISSPRCERQGGGEMHAKNGLRIGTEIRF